MKSFAKLVLLLFGSLVVLSGCSAISSILFHDSKDAAAKVPEPSTEASTVVEEEPPPVEEVISFTFYDSFANW
ncbi:MAG: hypothetical protein OXT68_12180 [Chloroflexota bacterium]|nr:hypothetical protein [Chloroflexota bacterium]